MVCPAQPLDALAVAVTRRIWIENGGELYKGAPWKPRLRVIEGRAKHKPPSGDARRGDADQ